MSRAVLFLAILLAATPAAALDIRAGAIHGDLEAGIACPRVCQNYGGWTKTWRKGLRGAGLCECKGELAGKNDEAHGGAVMGDSKAAWACVRACEQYGGWSKAWRDQDGQALCGCNQPLVKKK